MSNVYNSKEIFLTGYTRRLCKKLFKEYFRNNSTTVKKELLNFPTLPKSNKISDNSNKGNFIISESTLKDILGRKEEDRCGRTTFDRFVAVVRIFVLRINSLNNYSKLKEKYENQTKEYYENMNELEKQSKNNFNTIMEKFSPQNEQKKIDVLYQTLIKNFYVEYNLSKFDNKQKKMYAQLVSKFDNETTKRFYKDCSNIIKNAKEEYNKNIVRFNEKTFDFHLNRELKKDRLIALDYFFDIYIGMDYYMITAFYMFLKYLDESYTAKVRLKAIEILNNQTNNDVPYSSETEFCRKKGEILLNIILMSKKGYKDIEKDYEKKYENFGSFEKDKLINNIKYKIKVYNENNPNPNDNFYKKYNKEILFCTPASEHKLQQLQILYLWNNTSKKGRAEFVDYLYTALIEQGAYSYISFGDGRAWGEKPKE